MKTNELLLQTVANLSKKVGDCIVPEVWDIKKFMSLPRHPRQRNEYVHAERFAKAFLTGCHIDCLVVAAVTVTNTGVTTKLDGHTRAVLWQGLQDAGSGDMVPKKLVVIHYFVESDRESDILYDHIDSMEGVKRVTHAIAGGALEIYEMRGEEPKNKFVRNGRMVVGLGLMYNNDAKLEEKRGAPYPKTAVMECEHEIRLLDGIEGYENKRFLSLFKAAALLSFAVYGDKVQAFWSAYAKDQGVKKGGVSDGIQNLDNYRLQVSKRGGWSTKQQYTTVCARALLCIEQWLSGVSLRDIPDLPKDISASEWLNAYRNVAWGHKRAKTYAKKSVYDDVIRVVHSLRRRRPAEE